MIDISISSSKVRGRPKGRPNLNYNKVSEQIIYPERFQVRDVIYSYRKQEGLIYRKACGGFEVKGKQRFEPDLWE